ncbi:MAG: DUF4386 domain-containing protein [Chloroflexota bacterium]
METLKKKARLAGFFYLTYFVLFFLADNGVHSTSVGMGNAADVASKIITSEWLFRLGFVSFLFAAIFFLLAAWALYRLLKEVDLDLALLFLLLNLAGVSIKCVSLLCELAAMLILSGAEVQLHTLAFLLLDLYKNGFLIANIFFGVWLFPLGYLIYKSGFLPKLLGILLLIDGVAILLWFFQAFFFPAYEFISYPLLAESFIAEAALCLWLLIKGTRENQPALSEVD